MNRYWPYVSVMDTSSSVCLATLSVGSRRVCDRAAGRADLISGLLGGLLSWAFLCGSNGGDAQLSLRENVEIKWEQKKGTPGKDNHPRQKFSQKLLMKKKKVFGALHE